MDPFLQHCNFEKLYLKVEPEHVERGTQNSIIIWTLMVVYLTVYFKVFICFWYVKNSNE